MSGERAENGRQGVISSPVPLTASRSSPASLNGDNLPHLLANEVTCEQLLTESVQRAGALRC